MMNIKRFFIIGIALIVSINVNAQAGGSTYAWDNYPSGTFGPKNITFDFTGIRDIEHAPADGIHPRIFFNASDLPAIINTLQTTTSGQEVAKQIHAYTTLLNLGYVAGGYNHNTTYGSDAFGNRRIDNAGYWDSSSYYDGLIAGTDPTVLDAADNKRRYLLSSVMALEAFECLIYAGQTDPETGENYNDRANDLAAAMAYWAQIVIGDADLNPNNFNYFGGESMAIAYDLHYNSMTTAQQDIVRTALAAIIPANPRYGTDTEPYTTTSNWCGLNTFELITNLAIENEAGYNASLTSDYMKGYRKFLTYGWYESGTPYEGMGKNYQFVGMMIAAAKRGYSLLGHPYVKAYGENFLPAITQPYGHAFVGTDVWGGSGWDVETGGYKMHNNDLIGLKWAFPNSSKIDFAWRNFIEKWYKIDSEGYVYQQILPSSNGYHNQLLLAAIFCSDWNTGDWTTQNEAALNNEKSFFAPERGLGIMRSGFETDDLMVHFHCRQDLGGHTHGDRNNFTLSALGRTFVRYTFGSSFQETQYHSCMLVDDLGIKITNLEGKKARQPGKVLQFDDTDNLVQMTGDATYAYSWEWHWQARLPSEEHTWLGTDTWETVQETWNDFRYQAGTEFYHDLPFYDYANWNAPGKLERIIKRPYNPMQRVFRTGAVVRGNHPFVLIVDDLQKDNNTHNYKWLAQVASDLVIESTDVNLDPKDYRCDVILGEPASTGNRKLLVRVLNNNGYTSGAPAYLETVTPGINGNDPITRLIIEADVVAPDFRVLLYPYTDGDPLPVTRWNADKDELLVNIDDEIKILHFETEADNWTSIDLAYDLCTTTLDLTDTDLYVEGTFNVSDLVKSNEPICGNTVFKAGDCIELNGGFEVPSGLEFEGTIENCTPATLTERVEEQK